MSQHLTQPTPQATISQATIEVPIRQQATKIVAVDARNFFMGVLAARYDVVLVDQIPTDKWLPALVLDRVMWFMRTHAQVNLRPVFILDGPPSPLKARVIRERQERKALAEKQVLMAMEKQDYRTARQMASRAVRLAPHQQRSIVRVLQDAGFPVYQAPSEAEAQAAVWARSGQVDFVATKDWDAFLHGAPRVLRHWPRSEGYVMLSDVLEKSRALSWTHLMEASLLAGETDYVHGAPGYAGRLGEAVHALDLNPIDEVLRERGVDPTPWLLARELFLQPEVEVVMPSFEWGVRV